MAKITFRSYEIEKNPIAGGESFEAALDRIFQLNFPDRWQHITNNSAVSLYRYEPTQDGSKIFGEFLRISNDDFPMMVDQLGAHKIPMPDENNRIGKGAAFCYDVAARRLYLQYDIRIVTDSRAMYYLNSFSRNTSFSANVCLRDNVWAQIQRSMVKKVMIRVASPTNFGAVDDGGGLGSILNTMGQAYEAPAIYVEMSVGRGKDARLGERIVGVLERFRNRRDEDDLEVRSIKAQIKEDDESPEVVDLINDVFSIQQDLDLPKNDPAPNYRMRKGLLNNLINSNAFDA